MGTELISFDQDELQLIKNTIAKSVGNDEFKLFIQVCKQTGLNPFARQIYAVKRGTQMTIQTSIDGYRLLAQRSGEYAGQDGPYFYDDKNKEWTDVWCESYPPSAAKVGVLRKGFQKYLYAVARFESYTSGTNLWVKMPEVMIAKVAESLALRRAFPAELSGLYTKEEMDQADDSLPAVSLVPTQPAPAQPVEALEAVEGQVVESLDAIPTVSLLRTRCADLNITTKSGRQATLDDVVYAMFKQQVPDDALSPDDCLRISQYLDGQANKRKAS